MLTSCTCALGRYLLKYWLLRGRRDEHFRQRWVQAVDEVLERVIMQPPGFNFSFAGEMQGGKMRNNLDHLTCFWPGK